MKLAFFGTPELTLPVLNSLTEAGLAPSLVVAAPDARVGRKQVLTSPPSVQWAQANDIPYWQPTSKGDLSDPTSPLRNDTWDVFVIFAYGQIIPLSVLNLPHYQTINLHPSLLPQLRGPSPIRSAILTDQNETGVSIIVLDEHMDHGPIIAQTTVTIPKQDWPLSGPELDDLLVHRGADLLVQTLPNWCAGTITPQAQDHAAATYCQLIKKEDARLSLDPFHIPTGSRAYQTLLRIRAYAGWPGAFFEHNGQRVKITDASLTKDGQLLVRRVIPAGKKEMDFANYLTSLQTS